MGYLIRENDHKGNNFSANRILVTIRKLVFYSPFSFLKPYQNFSYQLAIFPEVNPWIRNQQLVQFVFEP